MNLNIAVKQTLSLSPQLLQSMEILQMSAVELKEYIDGVALENPAVEISSDYSADRESLNQYRMKLTWLTATDCQNRLYYRQDADGDEAWAPIPAPEGEDLESSLLFQLGGLKISPSLRRVSKYIILSLGPDGYLREDIEGIACGARCGESDARQGLNLVQSLEPAGVAARDLAECLCLQLDRMGEKSSLAYALASDWLDAIGKNRYSEIARALGVSVKEVWAACELLKGLNPRPAAGFSGGEATRYIIPDFIVTWGADGPVPVFNDEIYPRLSLSGYYDELAKSSLDDAVKDYLAGKLRQARWVIKSIEQRKSTLMSCAAYVVGRQERFFKKGPGNLVPMTLLDVARELSVHESTVSRAIRGKYIQCAHGVYPFCDLFSRALGSEWHGPGEGAVSADSAKARIRELILGENRLKPLSDQCICEILAGEGIVLSRRTVAKYRDAMGIGGASLRKRAGI